MATILVYFAYFKGWIFADFENISPQETHALLQKSNNILLIDVRSAEAFEKDHIEGAISVPLSQLLSTDMGADELLVYSERGELSVKAARILSGEGYVIWNLEGGVVFWIRAGYEVVHKNN